MIRSIKIHTVAIFRKHLANGFISYIVKFFSVFLVLYFGTLLIIGLSSKGNLYSPFVSNYLDFISPLRFSLLQGSKLLVEVLGWPTYFKDEYTLTILGGNGVRMVYSCVGYGVLSFWAAFIIANQGACSLKLRWLLLGWLILLSLNVIRLSFLLVADVKNWVLPFGLDHHTAFNILAYGSIFLLIYFFDKQNKVFISARSRKED